MGTIKLQNILVRRAHHKWFDELTMGIARAGAVRILPLLEGEIEGELNKPAPLLSSPLKGEGDMQEK